MEDLNQAIENHYHKTSLFEDILAGLKQQEIDLNSVTRADIEGVDEFHVRGAAVSKELANTIDLKGLKVLDVGCGLGGPSRMLADTFDCQVTGIDLSEAFVKTANALSKLVKLDDKTTFIKGDATNLPFKNHSFDVAWTQHVQMNIPNKERFYAEIKRVLKPNGFFLYYDIFKSNATEVTYPMPWATSAEQSFLFKNNELHIILNDLGFNQVSTINQTNAGITFFDNLMAKLSAEGPPKLGLNVLMGKSTKSKLSNLLAHLKSDALMLESGVYQKST